jgi:hypothetical protein
MARMTVAVRLQKRSVMAQLSDAQLPLQRRHITIGQHRRAPLIDQPGDLCRYERSDRSMYCPRAVVPRAWIGERMRGDGIHAPSSHLGDPDAPFSWADRPGPEQHMMPAHAWIRKSLSGALLSVEDRV